MKCAKIRLEDRSKLRKCDGNPKESCNRVHRFCQHRLVDPEHGKDTRWNVGVMKRSICEERNIFDPDTQQCQETSEELFLSVQTLKFEGDIQERKRPRNYYKYNSSNRTNHRMFVKQKIKNLDKLDFELTSRQSNDYFDDYVKYILNSDGSRPSTGKSSVCHEITKDTKDIQEDTKVTKNRVHKTKAPKIKSVKLKKGLENDAKKPNEETMNDAKITFQRFGKRKSLAISRAQSPETIQVIRVDVVCNYSNTDATISEIDEPQNKEETACEKKLTKIDFRNNPYANKYLLTKSIKTLDENVSGGAKVTLLCKTFRLSDRQKKGYTYQKPHLQII